jgi:hypothetical protein
MVKQEHERGFALIFAIAATALISLAVLLASDYLQSQYHAHQTEMRDVNLIAYGDGAMAETLARIANDSSFAGIENRRFGDGNIESSVQWLEGGAFVIVAKSRRGKWATRIVAHGHLTPEGPLVDRWERRITA